MVTSLVTLLIDTLKIELDGFRIADGAELTLQPASTRYQGGELVGDYVLWEDGRGRGVHGNRAYLNREDFNLTIAPLGGAVRGYVSFSVPRVVAGDNFYPVGSGGAHAAVQKVEGCLREAGVDTCLEGGRVSRLDCFRNVQGEEPFASYAPVLSLLEGRRQAKRDYGTTFLWENGQQQLCAYDKVEECRRRKVDTSSYPSNVLRFEHRILTHRKVVGSLPGVSTVGELLSGYDDLKEHYRGVMASTIFRYEPAEVQVLCASQLREELEKFRRLYGRQYRSRFLKSYGLLSLLRLADYKVIRETFAEVAGNRMARQRIGSELDRLRVDCAMASGVAGGKTLATLYRELRGKVLAA